MFSYLVLQDPGHNRVYYDQSQKMALAELQLACSTFYDQCGNLNIEEVAGIRYLCFEKKNPISATEKSTLSQLSFSFALFQKITHNGKLSLVPIEKNFIPKVDHKISSVLKYPGKTNELFTRMMINVARLSSTHFSETNVKLFDPVAGRGTTLYEGMIYGFDVAGMELQSKSVQESCLFIKKFFEKERYKHRFDKRKIYGKNNTNPATLCEFHYAKDKIQFKSIESTRKIKIIEGNSSLASQYYKKNTFHFIVGDLPYGVAHGNFSKGIQLEKRRNPYDFLDTSLAHWLDVLKPGGTMVLAWNTFVLSREKMVKLVQNNGFKVLSDSPYDEFEHLVDSSIKRDIIVALK